MTTMATAVLRVRDDEVAAKVLDEEAILIHLATGVYYSLLGAGARAFALLSDGHATDVVARALAVEYGTSAHSADADVRRLAAELVAEGLMVPADAGAAVPPAPLPAGPPATGYAAPALVAYRDMADLLALDPPVLGLGADSPPSEE